MNEIGLNRTDTRTSNSGLSNTRADTGLSAGMRIEQDLDSKLYSDLSSKKSVSLDLTRERYEESEISLYEEDDIEPRLNQPRPVDEVNGFDFRDGSESSGVAGIQNKY
ncbi:uncharacterized protein LOC111708915 [Eurytemora carolleeae]|uniref:uncharacterized protein LOC111708915 n=1 Tax=Eurytemora carolleeae TaxID=1294199 RepID=UPI000C76ACE6|nr:uncharacterized protein LOC111708915 [Eurytemora carolleeae]|eukprot:XP_023338191.1 uncharacterized protein LOC111708915 [Eurytemora affinis]